MPLDAILAAALTMVFAAGAVGLGWAAWKAKQREISDEVPIRRGRARVVDPDTELR